ncbi:MAG TPA: DEAD/DEAH box helicase family protein, partial [Chitinispirillaceae bacterium]|nr:DEAD/DEAH box helicase family protein [Chitinispirillaceae bacterium]
MSTVKFHFEDNLDFQTEAIAAAVGLFKGQEQCRSEFTVIAPSKVQYELDFGVQHNKYSTLGVGNRLELLPEEIFDNLVEIQFRNCLPPAEKLENMNFTIEMETGTGKTYVYLRTIFELNRQYGFTKFIIVVPSVAIKEGVYTTLRQTKEHFLSLYPGAAGYHYFLYDSANIEEVRSFATSDKIEIMVITVGAINKADVNNIYEAQEKTSGEKPIDLIRATRPVLIVDEPQSVDGGIAGKGKSALDAMDPLCTLRYSATHVDKYHQIYRLDSIAAYEKQLVKQI